MTVNIFSFHNFLRHFCLKIQEILKLFCTFRFAIIQFPYNGFYLIFMNRQKQNKHVTVLQHYILYILKVLTFSFAPKHLKGHKKFVFSTISLWPVYSGHKDQYKLYKPVFILVFMYKER